MLLVIFGLLIVIIFDCSYFQADHMDASELD